MEIDRPYSLRNQLILLGLALILASPGWAHSVSLHEAKLYELTRFQRLDLSTLKGKRFLLLFFQPDCPPCREQMRALKCLKEKRPDVNIVAAGVGEATLLAKEIRPLALNFPAVESTPKFQEMVDGVTSTPTTLFVAENGHVTERETGTRTCDDWISVVRRKMGK